MNLKFKNLLNHHITQINIFLDFIVKKDYITYMLLTKGDRQQNLKRRFKNGRSKKW